MAKQMRKAINFDLDTKKLKDAYCVTNRPLEYLKAYGEIKDFMKSKGFLHRQWSGYVSKEPLSKAQVDYLVQNMTRTFPWFAQCVEKFDVTNVGEQYDMMKKIETFDAAARAARAEEQGLPQKNQSQQGQSQQQQKNLMQEAQKSTAFSKASQKQSKAKKPKKSSFEYGD